MNKDFIFLCQIGSIQIKKGFIMVIKMEVLFVMSQPADELIVMSLKCI